MKIIFVLKVFGSNVSSLLNILTFRIKNRTILCIGLLGLVVSQRRLVWISGSASSLGCCVCVCVYWTRDAGEKKIRQLTATVWNYERGGGGLDRVERGWRV